MQRVTVKEVYPSTADNKPTVLVMDDGAKMSGFQAGLKVLNPGAILDVEVFIKGAYTNIKEFKLVEESPDPPRSPSVSSGISKEAIQAIIIAHLWSSGKLDDESKPVQWLRAWLNISTVTGTEKAEADKPFEELFSESGSEPITVKELLEYVASHGKSYNRSWLLEVLSIDTDALNADPVAHYHAINKEMSWGKVASPP